MKDTRGNLIAMSAQLEQALSRIRELEAELAEARRDGARLDHVIENFEEIDFDGWYDHFPHTAIDNMCDNAEYRIEFLKAWRKYLDKEMEAK